MGNSGGQHHHRINFDKYHPGYFGKVGMRYFHKTQQKFFCPIVNLDRIWALLSDSVYKKAHIGKKAPVVDVTKHGYYKVLGKGQLPKQPLVIKTKFISKLAEKKIKAVGGVVILTSKTMN